MPQATFEAIGTNWGIQLGEEIPAERWQRLLTHIKRRIKTFDKAYSRFRSDSLVAAIAKRAGTFALPDDGYHMLRFYNQLYRATGGKVTPLVGQLMADAGYDASYSFKPKRLNRVPRWEDVLTYDRHQLTVTQPVLLDFGAAGKGYLIDIIDNLLRQAGVKTYLINAGGDIVYRSANTKSMTVGLENPFDTSEVIGTIELVNQSICASAGSKRRWAGLHHIMDPDSRQPIDDIAGVWVIADDAMTADGLATALFFVDAEYLQKTFSFAYAMLGKNMNLSYSANFPVNLFEAVR